MQRYRARISGPLLDRLDMHIAVARLSVAVLLETREEESTAVVAARVAAARAMQLQRQGLSNAQLEQSGVRRYCRLKGDAERVLARAVQRFALSARAHQRILKLARTLADLTCAADIAAEHVAEAISLRQLDRAAESAR